MKKVACSVTGLATVVLMALVVVVVVSVVVTRVKVLGQKRAVKSVIGPDDTLLMSSPVTGFKSEVTPVEVSWLYNIPSPAKEISP